MNEDRFTIEVLTEKHWQIEDNKTGEFANPVDGTTNVLKGLVNTMNKFYNENEQLKQTIKEMIDIIYDSGLDYVLSDEVEEILND